jgi:YYY domain-containing protein
MTRGHADEIHRTRLEWLALVAVLVSAFALRIYDLNWDQGKFLHPDELHVTNVSNGLIHFEWPLDWKSIRDPEVSPFNPRQSTCGDQSQQVCQYPYGALPLLVTDFASETLGDLVGEPWGNHDHIPRVGRAISALVDTITVLLVFLVGARLFNRRAGLLSAAIYAGTPVAIQLSHFYTTDIWLACFVTLTLWSSLLALDRERLSWFALAGASFGLAMASKGSALLLGGVVAWAALVVGYRAVANGDPGTGVRAAMSRLAVSGASSLAAFALFEPYALVRLGTYIDQLREQQQMSSGTIDFPFTRRYVGTTPVLYQLEQLTRWGMGPVAALLGFTGVGLMAWWALRRRRADLALVLVWLGLQSIVIFIPEVKFLRYQIPIVPVLAIAAGVAIWSGYRWLATRVHRLPAVAFLVACLVGIGGWTAAFTSVYEGVHPRIAASTWIYANVPMGSAISSEDWDDSLPVSFGPMLSYGDMRYQNISFDIYGDRPQEEVADYLYDRLSATDYVIQSSNRLEESVRQAPWRYPVQIRYYDLLESGQLGFQKVAEFSKQPEIGPFSFDDSLADESWVNYDHPHVVIYQKTTLVDRSTFQSLMQPAIEADWLPRRTNPQTKSLMLDEPVGELPVVGNFRWSERLTSNSAAALGFWVAFLVLMSAIGRQWSRLLFPRFPDGGAGLARTLTLILAGWLLWFLASLELISFSVIWSWVALIVVALVGLGLWRGLADTKRWFPAPAIIGAEAVFWAVFALFLAFRWINPDSWHPIWGGEKPMEFAHLNATLRSAHFPPFDPWFAGGYINYYYYGLYLVAYCIKLTGIPAEIAFNLAQPTVMGLMASGAYSLAGALSSVRRRVGQSVAAGVLGATLVVLIGNLDNFFRVVKTLPDPIEPTFGQWTWDPSRAVSFTITEFPFFTGLYADLHAHGINVPVSMVVLGLCLSLVKDPYLTTLAVLRPRLDRKTTYFAVRLAMLGLGVGSVATTNSWDLAEYVAFTAVALLMTTAGIKPFPLRIAISIGMTAAVGVVAAILFSPFYANYVALFTTVGRTRDKTSVIQIANHFGGLLAIAGVAGSALLLARYRGRVRWFTIDPILPLALVAAALSVAVTTNLGDEKVSGLTVKIAAGIVCAVLLVPMLLTLEDYREEWAIDLGRGVLISALVAELILIIDGRGTLALMIAFFSLGATMWLFMRDRAERMTGALIACAAGIVGAIEIVFLEDNLAGGDHYRMNTVFKFYNQAWVLFAVAGGVLLGRAVAASGALGWFMEPARAGFINRPGREPAVIEDEIAQDLIEEAALDDEPAELASPESIAEEIEAEGAAWTVTTEADQHALLDRRWARAAVAVGAIAIAMSLFYPILATGPRLAERFEGHPDPGTLNAYDWMRYGTLRTDLGDEVTFDGDREAIYWFIDNVDGSPVIMEAAIGAYRGNGSRFSISTGLPTVIGWAGHESQQRYGDTIGPREAAVREFYSTTDTARKQAILLEYEVEYVVVGDVERKSLAGGEYWADPAGIAAIEQMVGTNLEAVFQSGATTVYRVVRDES